MDFISGLCFSYRSATGGAGGVQPLQFGRLVEAGANGDWSASPLLPIAAVDASLLPVDPDDEEHAVVDGSIQQIPLLVADLRLASRVSVVPGEAICFSPVVVANEMAFRELRALFRDGMEGVFRVTHELPEGMPAVGPASCIAQADFPLSPLRDALLGASPQETLRLLAAPSDPVESQTARLRFRHVLADAFASTLRTCAGKKTAVSFDLPVAPSHAAFLFGWPAERAGGPLPCFKIKAGSGHRLSFVVHDEAIYSPALVKEQVVLSISNPAVLCGLLGRSWSYYPIVDLAYRSGGFQDQNYCAVVVGAGALTFSYDITNGLLFVRAKVAKVSREQAIGGGNHSGAASPQSASNE